MGILFVLIVYGIALSIAASVAAVTFGATSYYLTRRSGPERKRAILASIIFPFACVVFAGAWFVAYAITSYGVFHRDPGLGDSWEAPLPNGYALMMIDTTDQGTVYNPKTQPIEGGVVSTNDAEFGVRQLQVSKVLIYGARDSGYFNRIGQESNVVDTYFELNASQGTRTEFKSLNELRQRAASQGVSLNLRDFYSVYSDYRFTWFDYLAGLILFLVPASALIALTRWVLRLRHAGESRANA
ncbi:MAG: hypothetical protein WBP90_09320, partial [Terracidiphilus sp.]